MHVLARAYADKPLDRRVVEDAGKLVYIASEEAISAAQEGDLIGVGFPRSCIFPFDSALFTALNDAWSHADAVQLEALWNDAVPIPPSKVADNWEGEVNDE